MHKTKCNYENEKFKFALLISTLIAVLILAFSFINSANAELQINTYAISYDFNVNLDTSLDICSCATYTNQITIKNMGNFNSKFYLTSSNSDVLSFKASEFNIGSGKTARIDYTISPDCNRKTDTILINVRNDYNIKKDYLLTINGNNCQNLAANLETSDLNINPCEPVEFNLKVENVGNFPESYYFDFGKFDKYANSEFKSVKLYPNTQAEFNITLQLPCNIHGNVSVPLDVYSDSTTLGIRFENNLNIASNYDYSVSLGGSYFTCSEDLTNFELEITNENSFDDTYFLYSDDPNFVSFEEKKIELSSGETKLLNLIVNPNKRNLGQHELKFHIKSKQSGISREFNSNLTVNKCYNSKITELQTKNSFCGGTPYVRFVVINNGSKENSFSLSMKKLNWFDNLFYASNTDYIKFNENNFILPAHTSREILIDTSSLPDVSAKYKIPFTLQIDGDSKKLSESVVIDYTSAKECHEVKVSPTERIINFDTTEMIFSIQNIGEQYSEYSINFIPRGNYSFINITSSNSFNVNLGRTQKEYFAINFDNSYLSKEEKDFVYDIIINVNNSYRPAEFQQTLTLQQRDKSVIYYIGKWIYENPIYDGIIIVAILLILFFLYLMLSRPKNLKRQEERKKSYKKVLIIYLSLIILALLLLLLLVPLKSIYPEITNNDSQFNHTLYSGGKVSIEVGDYFMDPDGDKLDYLAIVNSSENYTGNLPSIIFKEDLAIVRTPKNSAGNSFVVFKASDSVNSSQSSVFNFTTISRPSYSLYQYVKFYFPYVIWFAIGLFILIYVLAMYFWSKRKTIGQVKTLKRKKNKIIDSSE